MVKMYGIKNCNTVKKARVCLEGMNIEYQFCDYKKEGVDEDMLSRVVDLFGWENVVNRKGMTWRNLSDDDKNLVVDAESAMRLMRDKTSVIKRPILVYGDDVLVGFDESEYIKTFSDDVDAA